jgi:ADP-heptose:LPS heptosyltransferase
MNAFTSLKFLSRIHKRILVVRTDRVGDVVLSTPVYHTLKESFPDSFVGALVSPYASQVLERNPYIDVILTFDSAKENFHIKSKEIKKYKFDTALLLLPTKRIAYMLFLAGIPYRVGVGHILYEIITLMHMVSREKYNNLRHESDYMLDLARKIGAGKIWSKPEIFLSNEEKEGARKFLESKGFDLERPIVCIHPGCGNSAPNWGVEKYVELVNRLLRHGIQILVTGSKDEKDFEEHFTSKNVGDIIDDLSGDLRTSFGELSLRQLSAVLSQVSVVVSSSTGPMHVAAAVGTSTISMFCPMKACSPRLWGPIGNAADIILPPPDFCEKECPGNPHICTFGKGNNGIAVGRVFESIMRSLNRTIFLYKEGSTTA